MNYTGSMSDKKEEEEKEMTVACPLCLRRGKQSKVKLFQINYSEALVSCEDSQCPFPLLEGHTTNIKVRDFRNMKDEVPVKDSAPDNSDSGSESSSQNKPASTTKGKRVLKGDTDPNVSTTANASAVINKSEPASEVIAGQFDQFEFSSVSEQTETKKKKRKYYTGCRKRRSIKKPSAKPQLGIETGS